MIRTLAEADSAYEWVNKRTKPAKQKDNTMCRYRVKTRQLRSFDIGDIVEKRNNSYWLVTDNKNHCISLPKEMVENSRWFEPVDKVQEGQYWKFDRNSIVRLCDVSEEMVKYDYIDEDDLRSAVSREELQNNARKLSTPEIEQALKAEAKRRGYKNKVYIDAKYKEYKEEGIQGELKYIPEQDGLTDDVKWLYWDGNWASIVDQTPTIEINGYEPKYFDEYVKWGCAEVDKELFLVLDNLNDRYEGRKNVTSVTIGKGTFTMEQISQIADYYKDKEDDDSIKMYDEEGNVTVRFSADHMWAENE